MNKTIKYYITISNGEWFLTNHKSFSRMEDFLSVFPPMIFNDVKQAQKHIRYLRSSEGGFKHIKEWQICKLTTTSITEDVIEMKYK